MGTEDYSKNLVKRYGEWDLFLHPNQYFLGRMYIWARSDADRDLMEMTDSERDEFFEIGKDIKVVWAECGFKVDRINYAALSNISNHLHIHVIPRYELPRVFDGIEFVDGRWGKNYAPYDYEFEIPESTMDKLRMLSRAVL